MQLCYLTLKRLMQMLSKTTILPRLTRHFSSGSKSQNIVTVRLNSFTKYLVNTVNFGFFIKYPKITWSSKEMFYSDGCNCLLLFSLQGALQKVCFYEKLSFLALDSKCGNAYSFQRLSFHQTLLAVVVIFCSRKPFGIYSCY